MNELYRIAIHNGKLFLHVVFTRYMFTRYKSIWICKNPTPSSLARVVRAIQGLPVFGESCEWTKHPLEMTLNWISECGYTYHFEFNDIEPEDAQFMYCPYCGRRIVVRESER